MVFLSKKKPSSDWATALNIIEKKNAPFIWFAVSYLTDFLTSGLRSVKWNDDVYVSRILIHRFFREFESIFRPVFTIKVVLRLIFITLEIVQLSLLKSISDPRFTRTMVQMAIGFTDFLFFCASSEVVNTGEEILFRSLYKSQWWVIEMRQQISDRIKDRQQIVEAK